MYTSDCTFVPLFSLKLNSFDFPPILTLFQALPKWAQELKVTDAKLFLVVDLGWMDAAYDYDHNSLLKTGVANSHRCSHEG